MKKTILFLLTLTILLAACSGRESRPVSTPTVEPAPVSQAESTPQPTELVPVKVEPKAGDTRTYVDGSTIVYVPAGEFSMGVKGGEDNPIHTAYTDGFWIYTTEVTNAQYDLCVLLGQCTPADEKINPSDGRIDSLPVTGVQHEQAQGYCQWVRGHLPTEAEWEKAARGTDAFIYPWGNDAPACDKSNFADCQKFFPDSVIAREVGRSPYQLFDMAGNVSEWVQDWYDPEAYTKGITLNEYKVMRGGAFNSSAVDVRTFVRSFELPSAAREDLGFRCVLEDTVVQQSAPICQIGIVAASPPTFDECFLDLKATSSYCANGKPYVNIKWDTNEGIFSGYFDTKKPGSCEFGNPLVCSGPELASFQVKGSRTCTIENIGVTECPKGYELQNNMCVSINSGKEGICPQGFNTDVSNSCCSVMVASPPLCPPGYKYEAPHCKLQVSDTMQVSMPTCTIKDKPKEEPKPTCDPATGAGCP